MRYTDNCSLILAKIRSFVPSFGQNYICLMLGRLIIKSCDIIIKKIKKITLYKNPNFIKSSKIFNILYNKILKTKLF